MLLDYNYLGRGIIIEGCWSLLLKYQSMSSRGGHLRCFSRFRIDSKLQKCKQLGSWITITKEGYNQCRLLVSFAKVSINV